MKRSKLPEPDYQAACGWWADLPNIWTPVGWREHMFRFNVLYNGTLLAQPNMNRRTSSYDGQGLQLGFAPHWTNWFTEWPHSYLRHDDGQVLQGWTEDQAPVLWTEWARDGVVLRQYVFAHVPGGQETQTGTEPLFAWVRLTVHAVCPALPVEERHGFNLVFHRPHISAGMSTRDNIQVWAHQYRKEDGIQTEPDRRRRLFTYPRELKPEMAGYDPKQAYRILEPDGKVRLAVAAGGRDVTAEWKDVDTELSRPANRLYLQFPARKGASIDLLVPMLPVDRETMDRELAVGRDKALAESAAFWKRINASPSRMEVPEPAVGEVIRHSTRFSQILSERNPETKKVCKLSGAWVYADLWTTPGAMDLVMMMDVLGHHDTVVRYLDIFREEQGTVVPPGAAYEMHPGYLSTPALYKSIDWLSDNGAVLWTICMHYLLSGDREYLARFTDCIVKSCDWIKAMRAKTGHGGYEGVLPPAVATDAQTKIQAVWSIGWNYKGLCAAVRILKEIGHPRAAEFEAEAADYQSAYVKALRDKCRKMPVWTDARGQKRRFVPTALAGDEKAESRHAFYLDTGPLFHVFAGLLPAEDPLMKDTIAWFREGPQRAFYRRDSNCWQVPVLDHEMSSCEPCYSWNVFFSWQTGDRDRFMEGMYSLFAGSVSRKTGISCETRGGITGTVFSAPLAIYLARLAVVDDQIRPDELHLLRLMPLAWLKPGAESRFDAMPTEYGPVSLHTRCSRKGKKLWITWEPAFRTSPARVWLHIPPVPGLEQVIVNGVPARIGKKPLRLG